MTIQEQVKLENCPFCNSNDVQVEKSFILQKYCVYCPDCHAEGPMDRSVVKVINLWNTRSPNNG